MFLTVILGGLLGIILGFALQRSGFCMNSAFRNIIFDKDKSLIRSWLLALIINIVGIRILSDLGYLTLTMAPFYYKALLIGGFIFGIGMVLAGGCVSGTYYRTGRGALGSLGALIGFLFGAATMDGGFLSGFQSSLRSSRFTIGNGPITLYNLTGLENIWQRWILITILIIPIIIWLTKAPKQKFLIGWGWKKSGIIIGFIGVAGWLVSRLEGRGFGLSFTQPSISWVRLFLNGDYSGLNTSSYLVVGVLIGSFIAAIIKNEAKFTLPEPKVFLRQSFGGVVMGLGASLAGGCNIGHGLTGLSTLSVSSIIAVIAIMWGCWSCTKLVFKLESIKFKKENKR